MMPEMSGWEVARAIKAKAAAGGVFEHTPVLMLTGIGERLNSMNSPLFAADAWLDKPFEFTALDGKIAEVLDKHGKKMPVRVTSTASSGPDKPAKGAAKKASAKKAPAKKAAAKKPAVKRTAATKAALIKKAVAAKPAAKKAAPAKPVAPAKKAAPKKAAPAKVASKPVKKSASKSPVKAAAKSPARRAARRA
jgi:CheY-like chemotaxis protein